jgi:hypothetical protein
MVPTAAGRGNRRPADSRATTHRPGRAAVCLERRPPPCPPRRSPAPPPRGGRACRAHAATRSAITSPPFGDRIRHRPRCSGATARSGSFSKAGQPRAAASRPVLARGGPEGPASPSRCWPRTAPSGSSRPWPSCAPGAGRSRPAGRASSPDEALGARAAGQARRRCLFTTRRASCAPGAPWKRARAHHRAAWDAPPTPQRGARRGAGPARGPPRRRSAPKLPEVTPQRIPPRSFKPLRARTGPPKGVPQTHANLEFQLLTGLLHHGPGSELDDRKLAAAVRLSNHV